MDSKWFKAEDLVFCLRWQKQCKMPTVFCQHKCLALFSTSSYSWAPSFHSNLILSMFQKSLRLLGTAVTFLSDRDDFQARQIKSVMLRNKQEIPRELQAGEMQPWTFDGRLVMVEMPSETSQWLKAVLVPMVRQLHFSLHLIRKVWGMFFQVLHDLYMYT